MKEKQLFFSVKYNDAELLAEAEEYDVVMYGKNASWSKFLQQEADVSKNR